jgi:hypothetical protein
MEQLFASLGACAARCIGLDPAMLFQELQENQP